MNVADRPDTAAVGAPDPNRRCRPEADILGGGLGISGPVRSTISAKLPPYLKTDGFGRGQYDRGKHGWTPASSDGLRRGFVNGTKTWP